MSEVLIERLGAVAWLTLNRPDAGNAVDMKLARALGEVAAEARFNDAVRCVVLTGAGRMFCVGGDIDAFAAAGDKAADFIGDLASTLHGAVRDLAAMAKPLVTLINGPAAGAGLSLAILGDVALAARSARFATAYSGVGLTPDGGITWTLPRLIGLRRAQQMILADERLSADQAADIGLITRAVDDNALATEGSAIAERLAAGPTAAIAGARALIAAATGASTLNDALDREAASIRIAAGALESRERVAAFLKSRTAR